MHNREDKMVVLTRDADGTPTTWCDPEIVDLVTVLNTNGLRTVASCSGHGHRPGFISLQDGRVLLVCAFLDEARKADSLWPDINGEFTRHGAGDAEALEAVAWAVYGDSDEYGPTLLPGYCGSMEVIRNRVMEAAHREGFTGNFVQRMAELGWWVEPLFAAPKSVRDAARAGERG